MLTIKWTPNEKPPTLVPGSQWRRKSDGAVCTLFVDEEDGPMKGWQLAVGHTLIGQCHFAAGMTSILACDFEPLDSPQDTRTVGELEPGECFVGTTGKHAWMRTYQEERGDIVCVSLDGGVVDWFSPRIKPHRILGKIDPDDIAAIIREAGRDK